MGTKMLHRFRLKNQIIAKMATHFPFIAKRLVETFSPLETEGVPWTPVTKPLSECKIAMVTTAGVHLKHQPPFDMNDPAGDPTFRVLDISRPITDLMITHDYYDHSDADKDINIVFPVQRLLELQREGRIGQLARAHFGFMGHTVEQHIQTLLKQSAPEVARRLETEGVDIVLLTPG